MDAGGADAVLRAPGRLNNDMVVGLQIKVLGIEIIDLAAGLELHVYHRHRIRGGSLGGSLGGSVGSHRQGRGQLRLGSLGLGLRRFCQGRFRLGRFRLDSLGLGNGGLFQDLLIVFTHRFLLFCPEGRKGYRIF